VPKSEMPKGVEHRYIRLPGEAPHGVPKSEMPKGVEHVKTR